MAQIKTIDDYNRTLPLWGTSWTPSAQSLNGYNPSFYTGFAPRSENPSRIHVHVARGNQTRVTVILDDDTVRDYLFDLEKRAEFYKKTEAAGWVSLSPSGADFTPHARSFEQIVESPQYGISSFVRGPHSQEEIYAKSLAIMTSLNRNRIFPLAIDLRREFLRWKTQTLNTMSWRELQTPELAALAINTMLIGRVNDVSEPGPQLIRKLTEVLRTQNADEFVLAARDLFAEVTGEKYDFKVLNSQGQWSSPIQCASAQNCFLKYTEFTAVYPTGSVKNLVDDLRGNQIPDLALPGLWTFHSDPSADVDNIHMEPYYGFIPKLDYENQGFGFGFHNPAVRFYQVDPSIKSLLSIPSSHTTFWSVKRGGVSHGCSRLAAGHIWELRHILPVEDAKMKRVYLFANLAQEFDIFDIDGDGQLEVMGVEYLLSYDLQDAGNGLSREGQDLEIGNRHKTEFYQTLYGAQNVFHVQNGGRGPVYLFERPVIAVHTYSDFETRMVRQRLQGPDTVPLYEQPYEQDKIQFYDPAVTTGLDGVSQTPASKRLVRLFGRVRGCSPQSDSITCGENAFDREAASLARELGRPL